MLSVQIVKQVVRIFLFAIMQCWGIALMAQEALSLQAKYITESIKLDGNLDEAVWQTANAADNFWQFFPTDTARSKLKTSVNILYNDKTLYVGIRAHTTDNKHVIASLKRDFSGTANDNVALVFDTYSDGANAFLFGVTPYGVQREVLISQGGTREGFNVNWDIKWLAESKIYDDYYVVEIAIPFTSIKFKEGSSSWRFQTYRWDIKNNEQSAWARVPQNQLLSSLAFAGELVFEKPLGKSRTPVYLIPYVNALANKEYVANKPGSQLKVGTDAKIAVGNGMNLDLTVNPDFSNVEVDDIITNLTRFELRLPEKRQFFIDNNDLFDNFGNYFNEARPFFSRRIGLARDTTGNLIQNQIVAGVRLSGKVSKDWRLGFLNIQTAKDEANQIASYNNMMFALQRKVSNRSNVGVFMVNKQAFGDAAFLKANDKYNRVIGADYNLISKNNVWNGRFYVHKSFQPDDNTGNLSSQATMIYNTRKYNIISDFVYIDKEFRADLGFVPRRDVFKNGNGITRFFYPKKGKVNSHGLRLLSVVFYKPTAGYKKTDHWYSAAWTVATKKLSTFQVDVNNNYIFLTAPFDPTLSAGAVPLPGNKGYSFNNVSAAYTSNNAKLFTYTFNTNVGEFFNGKRYSLGGTLGYRIQPVALLSLAFNYDGVRLPKPHADADIWLISPRAEITFSKKVFWSTLIQYSNRRDNLGINSRLQWRFAPLSDLYLVYNDSYLVSDFGPRFRSINLKLTYWVNM